MKQAINVGRLNGWKLSEKMIYFHLFQSAFFPSHFYVFSHTKHHLTYKKCPAGLYTMK